MGSIILLYGLCTSDIVTVSFISLYVQEHLDISLREACDQSFTES